MAKLHSCVKIVLNLVFNEENKILLIQESKDHSRGLWFLPAGKIKEGESVLTGAHRETLEEAGIEVELRSLLKIEHIINKVYVDVKPKFIDIFRFIIISRPMNSSIPKNFETKDSIQAKWFTIDEVLDGTLQLRSYEVVELIEYFLKHKHNLKNIDELYHLVRY